MKWTPSYMYAVIHNSATQKAIPGLTNDKIVFDTQKYFKDEDRFHLFFIHLIDKYVDLSKNAYQPYMALTFSAFKEWLRTEKSSNINDYYVEFIEERYGKNKAQRNTIIEHLKRLDIKSVPVRGSRVYGSKLADLLENIILNGDYDEVKQLDMSK